MKTGRLLIAAVVMTALGGALYWSNKREAAKEGQPAKDASPKLLSVPQDTVEKIEIQPREGAATVLQKVNNQWELTAPKKLVADFAVVTAMLSTASSLNAERIVDENASNVASY